MIYVPKTQKLQYGDEIVLTGAYEKAKTARNYKEFDYREYLKAKNVYGTVNSEKIKLIKKSNLNYVSMSIYNLRAKIKSNLNEILGEKAGLTTRNFTPEIFQKFQMKLYKISKIVVFIIF